MFRPFLLCFLIITLWSGSVFSSPYPIASKIVVTTEARSDSRIYESRAYYDVTWSIVDLGSAADVRVPKGWEVGPGHRHYEKKDSVPTGNFTDPFITRRFRDGRTMSSAAMEVYSMDKNYTKLKHYGYIGEGAQECVGYYAIEDNGYKWSSVIYPPGSCVNAPPANKWCEITTPTITVDHGVLTLANDTTTTSKTTNFNVSCTSPLQIKIEFTKDVINLAKGVSSHLSVVGGNKFNAGYGNTTKQLESKLTVTPQASAGTVSGSTVMVVSFY